MEAPAGQVIQNKVGVRSIRVRVAATFVLVGPLQIGRRHAALGDSTAAVAVGLKPRFTGVAIQRQNETQHQRTPPSTIRRQHNSTTNTNSEGRGEEVNFECEAQTKDLGTNTTILDHFVLHCFGERNKGNGKLAVCTLTVPGERAFILCVGGVGPAAPTVLVAFGPFLPQRSGDVA